MLVDHFVLMNFEIVNQALGSEEDYVTAFYFLIVLFDIITKQKGVKMNEEFYEIMEDLNKDPMYHLENAKCDVKTIIDMHKHGSMDTVDFNLLSGLLINVEKAIHTLRMERNNV